MDESTGKGLATAKGRAAESRLPKLHAGAQVAGGLVAKLSDADDIEDETFGLGAQEIPQSESAS